jgi:hypothetical protein
MPDDPDSKELTKTFIEISKGFSELEISGTLCYIKHPTMEDFERNGELYERYLEKAKKMGVPTKEEVLDSLNKEGLWTFEEENEIEKIKIEQDNLKKTLKNLVLDQEKIPIKKKIKEVSEKLKKITEKRDSLIPQTAEAYANKKSNEEYLRFSIFKQKDLSELYYSEDEFNEIEIDELIKIFLKYNQSLNKFSEDNIMKIAVSDFFINIFNIYGEDKSDFFKKHPLDLTFYQKNLLNLGKTFDVIFKNYQIPSKIKKDPQKILDHIEEGNNKKKKLENISQKSNQSDGFSYAKAKRKDLEKMGVNTKAARDIHDIANDKGGELDMEDFMKIHKK